MATYTLLNNLPGNQAYWNVAANWSPAGTPTGSDTIVLPRSLTPSGTSFSTNGTTPNPVETRAPYYTAVSTSALINYGTLTQNVTIRSSAGQNGLVYGADNSYYAPNTYQTQVTQSLALYNGGVALSGPYTVSKYGYGVLSFQTAPSFATLDVYEGAVYFDSSSTPSCTINLRGTGLTSFGRAPLLDSASNAVFPQINVYGLGAVWLQALGGTLAQFNTNKFRLQPDSFLKVSYAAANRILPLTLLGNASLNIFSGSVFLDALNGAYTLTVEGSSTNPSLSAAVTVFRQTVTDTALHNRSQGTRIDFSGTGAPTTNILPAASTLTLEGLSVLSVQGKSATTNSQAFANTVLGAGSATLYLNQGSPTTLTVNLGAITQSSVAATLRLITSTTMSGTFGVITSNSAVNGILGGWAVGSANNNYPTDWLVPNGASTVTLLSTYYASSTGGNTAANYLNQNVALDNGITLSAGMSPNSLKITVSGNYTLAGTNIIQSGGILYATVGQTGTCTVAGGTLSGPSNGALYFHQSSTSASATVIASAIVDNGNTSVVVSGWASISSAIRLVLTGSNTYSGGTWIQGGYTEAQNPNAFGTGAITLLHGSLALVGPSGLSIPNALVSGVGSSYPSLVFRNTQQTPAGTDFLVYPRVSTTTARYTTGTLTMGSNALSRILVLRVEAGYFPWSSTIVYKPASTTLSGNAWVDMSAADSNSGVISFYPGTITGNFPLTITAPLGSSVVFDQPVGSTALTLGNPGASYLQGQGTVKGDLVVQSYHTLYVNNSGFGSAANPMNVVIARSGTIQFGASSSPGFGQPTYYVLEMGSILSNNGLSSASADSYIPAQNNTYFVGSTPWDPTIYSTTVPVNDIVFRARLGGRLLLGAGNTDSQTYIYNQGNSFISVVMSAAITEDATGSRAPVFASYGSPLMLTGIGTYTGAPVVETALNGMIYVSDSRVFGTGNQTITFRGGSNNATSTPPMVFFAINNCTNPLNIAIPVRLPSAGSVGGDYLVNLMGLKPWTSTYTLSGPITASRQNSTSGYQTPTLVIDGGVTATLTNTYTSSGSAGSSTQPNIQFRPTFGDTTVVNFQGNLNITGSANFRTSMTASGGASGVFTPCTDAAKWAGPVITFAGGGTGTAAAPLTLSSVYAKVLATNGAPTYARLELVDGCVFDLNGYNQTLHSFNVSSAGNTGVTGVSLLLSGGTLTFTSTTPPVGQGVNVWLSTLIQGPGAIVFPASNRVSGVGPIWRQVNITDLRLSNSTSTFDDCSFTNLRLSNIESVVYTNFLGSNTANSVTIEGTSGGTYLCNDMMGSQTQCLNWRNTGGTLTATSLVTSTNGVVPNFIVKPEASASFVFGSAAYPASGTSFITINVPHCRDITAVGAVAYPLVTFTTGAPAIGRFTLAAIDPTTTRISRTLSFVGNTLTATINVNRTVWKGTVNSTWDTTTGNWQLQSNPATTTFAANDCVLFDDTASSSSITFSATQTPALIQFNNSTLNYTFSGGTLGGTPTIVKRGTGTVTWGTTLNSGTGSNGRGLYVMEGTFIWNIQTATTVLATIYIAAGATFVLASSDANISIPTLYIYGPGTFAVDPHLTAAAASRQVIMGDYSSTLLGKMGPLFTGDVSFRNTAGGNTAAGSYLAQFNTLSYNVGNVTVPAGVTLVANGSNNFSVSGCGRSGTGTVETATGLGYYGLGALNIGFASATSGPSAGAKLFGNITLTGHTKITAWKNVSSYTIYPREVADVGSQYMNGQDEALSDWSGVTGVISGNFNLVFGSVDTSASTVVLTGNNTYTGTTWVGDESGSTAGTKYNCTVFVGWNSTTGTLGTGPVVLNGNGRVIPELCFYRSNTYTLAQNITATSGHTTNIPRLAIECPVVTNGYTLNLTTGATVSGAVVSIGRGIWLRATTRSLSLTGGTALTLNTLNFNDVLTATTNFGWSTSGSIGTPFLYGSGTLSITENSSMTFVNASSASSIQISPSMSTSFTTYGQTSPWLGQAIGAFTANLNLVSGSLTMPASNAGINVWGNTTTFNYTQSGGTAVIGYFDVNNFATMNVNITGGTLQTNVLFNTVRASYQYWTLSNCTLQMNSLSSFQYITMTCAGTVNLPLNGTTSLRATIFGPNTTARISGGSLNISGAYTLSLDATVFALTLGSTSSATYPIGYRYKVLISSNLTGSAANVTLSSPITYELAGTNTITAPVTISTRARLLLTGSYTGGTISTTTTSYIAGNGTCAGLTIASTPIAGYGIEVDGSLPTALTCTTLTKTGNVAWIVYNAKNAGNIRLINYTTLAGSGTHTTLVNTAGFRSPAFTNPTGQINLTYTTAALTWSGSVTDTWGYGTAQAGNFTGSYQQQLAGDTVTFNDTATQYTVYISGSVNPDGVTVNNSTNNYTFTTRDGGGIWGPGGVTKSGTATLTLSEAMTNNNFLGNFTINAGTVNCNFRTALGLGSVILAGGTLVAQDATSTNGTVLYVPGNFTFSGGSLTIA